ncbi:hypothetical protein Tco_0364098 [Tanacetum coccineum]
MRFCVRVIQSPKANVSGSPGRTKSGVVVKDKVSGVVAKYVGDIAKDKASVGDVMKDKDKAISGDVVTNKAFGGDVLTNKASGNVVNDKASADVVRPKPKADLSKDKPKADLPKDKSKEKPKPKADLRKDKRKDGVFVDKFVRDPNKTPDSSQRPPQIYPKCGNPVDGLYCRQCALLRKKLKEVWSTICYEDEIFQDFLNTSESSNDKTNVVNAPQEPFVFNQDPGENSSQRPPHIDHHCCYGCGDSLDGIFCQRCTCESCGNGAHYGYNCPPKVPTISNPEPCHNQNVDEFPQTLPSFHPTCYSGDGSSFTYDSTPNFVDDSPNVFNPPSQPPTYSCEFCGNDAHYGYDCPPQIDSMNDHLKAKQVLNDSMSKLREMYQTWLQQRQEQVVNLDSYTPEPSQCRKIPIYYDDDDDEESSIPLRDIIISELPPCITITPVLLTEEPVDSLIMEDKHLDTISALESDELIKSSVENLVHTPSESDGISESECDLPV